MKVVVNISLKEGVLDPEGQAIQDSLINLDFKNLKNVRTGKQIVLDFTENFSKSEAIQETEKMCKKLLVNTVIEKYKIEVLEDN
tara:strand:+ start:389 stop:640 length:252 start_codon:yes stop_codon:yes gene_type:complete